MDVLPEKNPEQKESEKGELVAFSDSRFVASPWLLLLGMFVLIVLVIIIVLMAFILTSDSINELGGLFVPFDVDSICSALPPGSTCFGPNSATPYYRSLFPLLGDNARGFTRGTTQERFTHLVGAHPMSLKEGILVYGKRPQNQVFFSFTAYVYDIPFDGKGSSEGRFITWASVSDSVNIDTTTPGLSPYIGYIFTPNPNMAGEIMKRFLKKWDTIKDPIEFYTNYIPQYLYNPTYRYQILARLKMSTQTQNQPIPKFSCTWYQNPNMIDYISPVGIPFVPRAEAPDELKLVSSLAAWNQQCLALVQTQYTVISTGTPSGPFVRYPFLIQYFPEGLNWGWQCVDTIVGCQADTRSTIYYTSFNIPVTKEQAIVVVALDHVMTQTSFAYCNINFYNQVNQSSFNSVDTGVRGENLGTIPPKDLSEGMRMIYQEIPDDVYDPTSGIATIANSERCYVSKTGVGPSYRIILPAFTCIVAKKGSTAPVPPHPIPVPEPVTPIPENWIFPNATNNYGLNAVLSSI